MARLKPVSEEEWKAESDAKTLLDAQAILQDSTRLSKAKPKLRKLAAEKTKEAKAAQALTSKLGGSAKRPRTTSRRRKSK